MVNLGKGRVEHLWGLVFFTSTEKVLVILETTSILVINTDSTSVLFKTLTTTMNITYILNVHMVEMDSYQIKDN